MKDFDVCMGTGDIPTPENSTKKSCKTRMSRREEKIEEEEMKRKGYIKDRTGSWFNPDNPVDAYFMDW